MCNTNTSKRNRLQYHFLAYDLEIGEWYCGDHQAAVAKVQMITVPSSDEEASSWSFLGFQLTALTLPLPCPLSTFFPSLEESRLQM